MILEEQGLAGLITDAMAIDVEDQKFGLNGWSDLVDLIKTPKERLKIAVVGKYVDLHDSYISVKEALIHAGLFHSRDIEIDWIGAEDVEKDGAANYLSNADGIVVPGGFGYRGVEGMVDTVKFARENNVPYLGLCLGMQVMVIEAARNLLGKEGANSSEFDSDTKDPVIDLMSDQLDVKEKGGTMRLGVYPCVIEDGSIISRAYGKKRIMERHRHRFEFNNAYKEDLKSVGLLPTGISPDGRLVEIVEYKSHPFMAGTQFHPEFLSRPTKPHPLFREFIAVAGGFGPNSR